MSERRDRQEKAAETLEQNRERFREFMERQGYTEGQREEAVRDLDRRARELREEAERAY